MIINKIIYAITFILLVLMVFCMGITIVGIIPLLFLEDVGNHCISNSIKNLLNKLID